MLDTTALIIKRIKTKYVRVECRCFIYVPVWCFRYAISAILPANAIPLKTLGDDP